MVQFLGHQTLIQSIIEKRNPQIDWKRALKLFHQQAEEQEFIIL